MDAKDDVVVVARNSSGTPTVVSVRPNPNHDDIEAYNPNEYQITGKINVSVRVKAASINSDKAREAARNVAEALLQIIEGCNNVGRSTTIPLPNGKSTTAGKILDIIKDTKFIVVDANPFPANGGKGGADRTTMTDTLYFRSFVEGSGERSYTNGYWQGEGMMGIMLHEIGHLSEEGFANLQEERRYFAQENGRFKMGWPKEQFYRMNYSADDEMYAHAFGTSAANVLGIKNSNYDGIFKQGYSPPYFRGGRQVYNENLQNH